METYIIAHQIFASRLLVWLHSILESAQTFRLIFSDIINKVCVQDFLLIIRITVLLYNFLCWASNVKMLNNSKISGLRKASTKLTTWICILQDGGTIVESIIWTDTKMWKTARVQWHRLFISGMLMDQESKKMFARVGCFE